jgi:hypothetical protein
MSVPTATGSQPSQPASSTAAASSTGLQFLPSSYGKHHGRLGARSQPVGSNPAWPTSHRRNEGPSPPWWLGVGTNEAGCVKVGSTGLSPPNSALAALHGGFHAPPSPQQVAEEEEEEDEGIVCIGLEEAMSSRHSRRSRGSGTATGSSKRPGTASPLARVALGSPNGAQQLVQQPQTARELHFALLALHSARSKGSSGQL